MPGYYPDAQGAMRWWTGRDWTPHTQSPAATSPEPPNEPPKKRKKPPFLVRVLIILAFPLLIAGCGALLAIGGGDTKTTTPATTDTDIEEDPDLESEPSGPPTYRIGEKARDDAYQFTVTKIRCGVSRIGSADWGEKAQGQFCLVSMKVKNVGKEPIDFSDENQALFDSKGREYSPDDGGWLYLEDNEILPEINPGNAIKTTVPFDIPKKAKPDHLLLKAGYWGASEGVKVQLS